MVISSMAREAQRSEDNGPCRDHDDALLFAEKDDDKKLAKIRESCKEEIGMLLEFLRMHHVMFLINRISGEDCDNSTYCSGLILILNGLRASHISGNAHPSVASRILSSRLVHPTLPNRLTISSALPLATLLRSLPRSGMSSMN